MIDLFRRLFCKHEWQDISGEIHVWDSNGRYKYPIGAKRIFVCKKCLKKRIIKY